MNPLLIAFIGIVAVLALASIRMPVALAMAVVGAVGVIFARGLHSLLYIAGTAPFEALNNYALSVLPLFILMGELAVRSALSKSLIDVANAFLGHRRGGLASAACVSCAGFGAISGSDIATLSAITKISVPEMLRSGYSKRLTAGALASGGTLGILIPPSVPMIIYGFMTETSIGRLFSGGIVPGIILTIFYIGAISVWVKRNPNDAPQRPRVRWRERTEKLVGVWPVLLVFVLLMGGIYAGFFSPTEGGAVGAFGMLTIGVWRRQLSWSSFFESVHATVMMSAVIFFMLIGIELFRYFMDSIGLQIYLSNLAQHATLPPIAIMAIILVVLMVLGCIMDSLAIMFITVPILAPLIVSLGFDPVWFGIVMVMVVSLGLITPPFGLNIFVLSTLVPEISIREAFKGVMPFVIADSFLIVLSLFFPAIVLWLPNLLFN